MSAAATSGVPPCSPRAFRAWGGWGEWGPPIRALGTWKYCWVLRCSRADWDATAILATLLALWESRFLGRRRRSPRSIPGWDSWWTQSRPACCWLQSSTSLSWPLSNGWPRGTSSPARRWNKPWAFPPALLGHRSWFVQRFPLASPFAPTLPWTGASDAGADKQADHAWVGGWCSDVPNPDKSRVKWFQHRITPEGEPWAFTTGDPQRAIAALELFGLLLLVRAVLLCAAGSASHTRILVASDNQGNVFSLLNDSTRRMPNAAILMEIVLTLHDHQVMLGPSHVKRDFNTWADELTHPDPQFPTENRVFPSVESELIKLIFATFLPHP